MSFSSEFMLWPPRTRNEVRPRQHASESTQCCCGLCRFAGAPRWMKCRVAGGGGLSSSQKVRFLRSSKKWIQKMTPIGITFEGPLHHSWSICKEAQHPRLAFQSQGLKIPRLVPGIHLDSTWNFESRLDFLFGTRDFEHPTEHQLVADKIHEKTK